MEGRAIRHATILLAAAFLTACGPTINEQDRTAPTTDVVCFQVTNDAHDAFRVELGPAGTPLGRVSPGRTEFFELEGHPPQSGVHLRAEGGRHSVTRLSPLFDIGERVAWKWTVAPRMQLWRNNRIETDFWPIERAGCYDRRVQD